MKIDTSKFSDKKQLFKYLVENKSELISLKKSEAKHSDSLVIENKEEAITKGASNLGEDDLANGIIKRTIVGNTYNWMDSHDDVHMKGIFTKSISENKSIMHLHDHLYQLTAKVGTPLKVYEKEIAWTELGVPKAGVTTALLMDSEIKSLYNAMIYDQYLNKQIQQHSVGMSYIKLFLCINDAEYKEEFANWNNYIPFVANQDKATKQGYFWAVTEAKLIEISAVINGSNELTPTLDNKSLHTIEPPSTQKEEPVKKGLNLDYLINNF